MITNVAYMAQFDHEEEALLGKLFKQKHNKLQQYNGNAGSLLQNMNDTKKDALQSQHIIQLASMRMMEIQYVSWNADHSAKQKDSQYWKK